MLYDGGNMNSSKLKTMIIISYVGGYINDTTAIDNINFQMDSGNFDGVIQMYGIA